MYVHGGEVRGRGVERGISCFMFSDMRNVRAQHGGGGGGGGGGGSPALFLDSRNAREREL